MSTQDPAERKEFWDMHDLARMFDVSTRTLRTWWQRGTIPPPAVDGGKKKLWHRSQFEGPVASRGRRG